MQSSKGPTGHIDGITKAHGRPLGGRILINTKRLLRYWVFLSLLEVVLDSRFLARLHFSSPRLRARREKSRQILFLRLHLATTPTHPGWPRLDATHCSESAKNFQVYWKNC